MAVKSKILVVKQKDSGSVNNFPGFTCTPKISKFYDFEGFMIWLVSPEITQECFMFLILFDFV